ncbi:MAG: albusnodin/ikarugamycin family macrolactam cyclase [Sciscionella sp.]
MMWWLASAVDRRTPHTPNVGASPDCAVVTTDRLRLWHGPSGSVVRLSRVDVPGCQLLVAGCCTTPEPELHAVADRLAQGDTTALGAVDGSCVVIAVRSDDVLVAGDLAGQCPVFFTRIDGTVVVGSHAGNLAELVGGTLDRAWLATRLLVPTASDVWWTGTPWQAVHTVRPGWLLGIDSAGQATTTRWLDLGAPTAALADGGHALQVALQQAVAGRVAEADQPTLDLSGGLDSSTVAVLATAVADGPIRALTLTVDGVDDAAAAVRVADAVDGLIHEQMDIPESVLPYSDLDQLPVVDEPGDYLVAGAWGRWWRERVAEYGSDVHLGGDGGDGVLLALPSYLADLAGPRTARTLWRHASGWARLRHQSPRTLIRAASVVRRTPYRVALTRAADNLINGSGGPTGWARLVSWVDLSGASTWATTEARRLVGERLRQHADEHTAPVVPGTFGIGDATAWLSLNAFSRGLRSDVELAASCGVTLQSPYLDDGVVRACWSVPAFVRTTPDQPKPLLRHAVDGLVPSSIVDRRTKGDYTALSYRGLQRNADQLDHLLAFSRLAALGLINIRAVRDELRKGAAGIPIRLGAFDAVIGMELWLRSTEVKASTMSAPRGGSGAFPT